MAVLKPMSPPAGKTASGRRSWTLPLIGALLLGTIFFLSFQALESIKHQHERSRVRDSNNRSVDAASAVRQTVAATSPAPEKLADEEKQPAKKKAEVVATPQPEEPETEGENEAKDNTNNDNNEKIDAEPPFSGKIVSALTSKDYKGKYVRLYHKELSLWLGRAIDTNIESAKNHEKIFKIRKMNAGANTGWAIQGHTRLHLTNELNNKITLDRGWARGYEMWTWVFGKVDGESVVYLQSLRNQKFVRVFSDRQSLVADVADTKKAAAWTMFEEPGCSTDSGCWGPLNKNSNADRNSTSGKRKFASKKEEEEEAALDAMTFPLFGSPKPLQKLEPLDAKNKYDPYIIARRTLDNWVSIPGMDPVVFTDDDKTVKLIGDCNQKRKEMLGGGDASTAGGEDQKKSNKMLFPNIAVHDEFEQHNKFNRTAKPQPTYRGLFAQALKLYPDSEGIMYSNSDILYTPALPETIKQVIRYVKKEKQRVESVEGATYRVKGWMLVGQRINHDIPPTWQIRDSSTALSSGAKMGRNRRNNSNKKKDAGGGRNSWDGHPWWVRDIEEKFSDSGELFQSNAEDYFIVSRSLFDWMGEIGDFIVGGVAFDNWIVARAVRMATKGEAIVVDASKTITALHQNHARNVKDSHNHPKSLYNSHLAARTGGVSGGKTAEAAYATERQADGTISVYDKHRLMYL